jgi:hypothetical protein
MENDKILQQEEKDERARISNDRYIYVYVYV